MHRDAYAFVAALAALAALAKTSGRGGLPLQRPLRCLARPPGRSLAPPPRGGGWQGLGARWLRPGGLSRQGASCTRSRGGAGRGGGAGGVGWGGRPRGLSARRRRDGAPRSEGSRWVWRSL